MLTIHWNLTHLIFLLSRSRFNVKIIFIKHWPIATPKFVPKSKMPKFSLTDASNMPILILQSKINFLTNLPSVSRHFSHVTKSRIFKNLNLRKKADRNFRCDFLENHFRHVKSFQAFKSPKLIGQKLLSFWHLLKNKRLTLIFLREPIFQVLIRGSWPPKKT